MDRVNVIPVGAALILVLVIILAMTGIAKALITDSDTRKVNPYSIEEEFDGTVVVELVDSILEDLVGNAGINAIVKIHELSRVTVIEELEYLRGKVVRYLVELVNHTWRLRKLQEDVEKLLLTRNCIGAKEYEESLKKLLIKAFSAKYRLIDEGLLEDFISKASKYIRDPNEKSRLLSRYKELKMGLEEYLEELRLSTIEALSDIRTCKIPADIVSTINVYPAEVFGGDNISISGYIRFLNGTPIANSQVIVGLSIASYTSKLVTYTDINGHYNASLMAPTVEEVANILKAVGVNKLQAKVYIYYTVEGGYTGYNETKITIVYEKPKIILKCPKSIELGKDLEIPVIAEVSEELNVSISINGEFYVNKTITPGENLIMIPGRNLTLGPNTISFRVRGYGKYITTTYSCTVMVTREALNISLIVDYIVMYPFDTLTINGYLTSNNTSRILLTIYVDGKPVYNGSKPYVIINVPPPPTLILSQHNLTAKLVDLEYNTTYTITHNVIVVNPLGLVMIVIAALAAATVTPRHDIIPPPSVIADRLRTLFTRAEEKPVVIEERIKPLFHEFVVKVKFRVAKLVGYYKVVVRKLSKYVGEPLPSETLREYMYRVMGRISGRIAEFFRELTLLVEKDLYSKNGVSSREETRAREIAEMIRDEV